MKNPTRQPSKPVQEAKRSFTWGIKTSEIAFMEGGAWDAPMEGCNCGPLVITRKPRDKAPQAPKR